MMDPFLDWHNEVKGQVTVVYNLMKKSLSDEPTQLIKELTEIEAWNSRVGFLLADANGHLDCETFASRPGKDLGSETDRKTTTDAMVSPVRVVRDKLEALASCIKQRLILGESMLRYMVPYKDHGISK